jgi:hypothetical protein
MSFRSVVAVPESYGIDGFRGAPATALVAVAVASRIVTGRPFLNRSFFRTARESARILCDLLSSRTFKLTRLLWRQLDDAEPVVLEDF